MREFMNRTIFEEQNNETFIKTYDSINWYFHIIKKYKSDCVSKTLCYLMDLQDKHEDEFFEADRNYIGNRINYAPDAIGDALQKLEDTECIFKIAKKGLGTRIKIRYETLHKISNLYKQSNEYLSWQVKNKQSKAKNTKNKINLPF